MAKLGCNCGHIIRDQACQLQYKARFLRNFDQDAVFDALERECEALIDAVIGQDRESWIRRHFTEEYPRDLSNGSIFFDFMASLLKEHMDTVYECEGCGRLWVQQPGAENEFAAFTPDSGRLQRVLRSARDQRE